MLHLAEIIIHDTGGRAAQIKAVFAARTLGARNVLFAFVDGARETVDFGHVDVVTGGAARAVNGLVGGVDQVEAVGLALGNGDDLETLVLLEDELGKAFWG